MEVDVWASIAMTMGRRDVRTYLLTGTGLRFGRKEAAEKTQKSHTGHTKRRESFFARSLLRRLMHSVIVSKANRKPLKLRQELEFRRGFTAIIRNNKQSRRCSPAELADVLLILGEEVVEEDVVALVRHADTGESEDISLSGGSSEVINNMLFESLVRVKPDLFKCLFRLVDLYTILARGDFRKPVSESYSLRWSDVLQNIGALEMSLPPSTAELKRLFQGEKKLTFETFSERLFQMAETGQNSSDLVPEGDPTPEVSRRSSVNARKADTDTDRTTSDRRRSSNLDGHENGMQSSLPTNPSIRLKKLRDRRIEMAEGFGFSNALDEKGGLGLAASGAQMGRSVSSIRMVTGLLQMTTDK